MVSDVRRIDRYGELARIREQLPSFTRVDDKGRNAWEDDEGPLGYIRVAALACHLTDLAGRGEWDKVKAVLDVA
jgi:hypothetical protein